jgi:hypothetical protein
VGNGGVETKMEKINEVFWFYFLNSHVFQIVAILTNFLCICHLEFTYEVIGDEIEDLANYGWDGDF